MSETFKAFVPDAAFDDYHWREYTAVTLAARVAEDAVFQHYRAFFDDGSRAALLERACLTGFVPAEWAQICKGWVAWWTRYGESTAINGPDFVPPELPQEADIIAAIRARAAEATQIAA